MKKTEIVKLDWADINVLSIEGAFLDDIIDNLYEQIRSTAKTTKEWYINKTKWELTYDDEVMEFTIKRILPT